MKAKPKRPTTINELEQFMRELSNHNAARLTPKHLREADDFPGSDAPVELDAVCVFRSADGKSNVGIRFEDGSTATIRPQEAFAIADTLRSAASMAMTCPPR